MKQHDPVIKLVALSLPILEKIDKGDGCGFSKDDVFRAAEAGRMIDFIGEVTGKDGLLSWITFDPAETKETNERLGNAVIGVIGECKSVTGQNGYCVLLEAILLAIQSHAFRGK